MVAMNTVITFGSLSAFVGSSSATVPPGLGSDAAKTKTAPKGRNQRKRLTNGRTGKHGWNTTPLGVGSSRRLLRRAPNGRNDDTLECNALLWLVSPMKSGALHFP